MLSSHSAQSIAYLMREYQAYLQSLVLALLVEEVHHGAQLGEVLS